MDTVSNSESLPDPNISSQEPTRTLPTTDSTTLTTSQHVFDEEEVSTFNKDAANDSRSTARYDTDPSGNGPIVTSEPWIPVDNTPLLHLQEQQPQSHALVLASPFNKDTWHSQPLPFQELDYQVERGPGGSNYASGNQAASPNTATKDQACQQHIQRSITQSRGHDLVLSSSYEPPLQERGLYAHRGAEPIVRAPNWGHDEPSENPIDGNFLINSSLPESVSRKHDRSPSASPPSQPSISVETTNPQAASPKRPLLPWTQETAMSKFDTRANRKRTKRRYGPEEKLQVAETRREGSCLRCKGKKKKDSSFIHRLYSGLKLTFEAVQTKWQR